MRQTQYSNHVQQRPLTTAGQHDRQYTELAGTTAKRPAAPLVRDQEAVPSACPMKWSTKGYDSHSRTTPQASRPGFTYMSLFAKET
jgi:hypothetical protein